VTAGHRAAPAGTHPCRPWQVGHARWRLSTGGAPPLARHWPPEQRRSPAMPQPPHACKWHRHDPTYPQPTSRALISQPRPLLARTRIRLEPPSSRHWRRQCAPVRDSPEGPLKNRGESCLKPAKNKRKMHLLSKHAHRARPTPRWPLRPTAAAQQGAPPRAGPPRSRAHAPLEQVPPRSRVHASRAGSAPLEVPSRAHLLPHAYGHLMT
jgi:hypothetical protein